MTHFLGKEEYTQLAEALALPAPTSIRINKQKETISALNCQLSTLNCQLSTVNCQLSPVPWCPDGFYLSERPSFTFDPLFHAGCY